MKYLDITLPTPQHNLACDEALLEAAEAGQGSELLRLWEPAEYFVVLGHANRTRAEVNLVACRKIGLPILRRVSGGGTVLQGPGCLNYALVLRIGDASVTTTNRFIMQRHQAVFQELLGQPVAVQGVTDLTIGGRKFSGNAQRRKKQFLLFHGSFLLGFDLARVERYLAAPSRQPTYRQNRPHREFLTNVPLTAAAIKRALAETWEAVEPLARLPEKEIAVLAAGKYSSDDWNFKM